MSSVVQDLHSKGRRQWNLIQEGCRPWARGGAADGERGDDRVNPRMWESKRAPRSSLTQGPTRPRFREGQVRAGRNNWWHCYCSGTQTKNEAT